MMATMPAKERGINDVQPVVTTRDIPSSGKGTSPAGVTLSRDVASTHSVAAQHAIRRAAACAMADVRKLFNDDGSLKAVDELDAMTAAAIEHVDVREPMGADDEPCSGARRIVGYRFGDRAAAVDVLMRHLGLYPGADSRPSPRVRRTAARIVRQAAESAR